MISSALANKTKTTKMKKRKLNIVIEVLNDVSIEFPETMEFINEKLDQICSKESISTEEVFYLKSQAKIFIMPSQILKRDHVLLLRLHLASYVKEYNL